MNYYEHHLGDYAEACGHLSWLEDMAYTRMLRKYFAKEQPLPADVTQVQRLMGAKSPEELAAVESVLHEFFELTPDGWRNERADEEIARFRDKQAKAKASAEARWGSDQNSTAKRTHSGRSATAKRTNSDRNAHQTPDTRQEDQEQERGADENLPDPPTPPVPPPAAADAAPPGIWDVGLAAFNKRGIHGPPARSLLGKLRQVAQGQCGGSADAGDLLLLELLAEVERQDIVDPAAWLRKALMQRGGCGARASPAGRPGSISTIERPPGLLLKPTPPPDTPRVLHDRMP